MKLQPFASKDKMSRREFLRAIRLKSGGVPSIDREKCTGCGLCAIDCPAKALTVFQDTERDTYQLLLQRETCDGCGICEKSCPEKGVHLVDREDGQEKIEKGAHPIFEDTISRCRECGRPLFPRALVKKLQPMIAADNAPAWPFDLCPSCRLESQFGKEMIGRMET